MNEDGSQLGSLVVSYSNSYANLAKGFGSVQSHLCSCKTV